MRMNSSFTTSEARQIIFPLLTPPRRSSLVARRSSQNDVVAVTRLEYEGDTQSCPVDPDASKLDCVVSGVGPAYVDMVVDAGKFEEVSVSRQAEMRGPLTTLNDLLAQNPRQAFKSNDGFFRLDRFFSPTSHER